MAKLSNKTGVLAALVVGTGTGFLLGRKASLKKKDKFKMYADKHLAILQLFNQWLVTKQEKKSIAEYLKNKGFNKIAIYGMGYVGERLFDELKDSDVKVEYAIDKNADGINMEIDVFTPEEELPDVDLIIVTAIYFYAEIERTLKELTDNRVSSLEDILYEM